MELDGFTMSVAQPSDAAALTALVNDCYGDTCSDTLFYDSILLANAIADCKLVVYIACYTAGVPVAMEVCQQLALFPDCLYLKAKMTSPAYRSRGIGKALADFVMSNVNFSGFKSAFAFSLSYNDISQTLLHDNGFVMTGLLYNSYMRTEDEQNIVPGLLKRSHVIMVKRFDSSEPARISLPPFLQAAAPEIYNSLGLRIAVCEASGEPLMSASQVNALYNQAHHNTEIVINLVGADLEERLRSLFAEHDADPLQTYNLFLNLCDSGASAAIKRLQAMGFVPSGLLPLSAQQEYLVLYRSVCLRISPKAIKTLENYHERKVAFINLLKGSNYEEKY